MRIVRNPDKEYANDIQKQIRKNGGYCLSKLDRNKDNKCMCKEFKLQEEAGMCSCGLYVKTE